MDRLSRLSTRLREYPVAVPISTFGPGIVDGKTMQLALFKLHYSSVQWAATSEMIVDAERGDGRSLFEAAHRWYGPKTHTGKDPFGRDWKRANSGFDVVTTGTIACADAVRLHEDERSEPSLMQHMRDLRGLSVFSEMWAAMWSLPRAFCHAGLEAYERYHGPWSQEEGLRETA